MVEEYLFAIIVVGIKVMMMLSSNIAAVLLCSVTCFACRRVGV
jgi:hypothetical protein